MPGRFRAERPWTARPLRGRYDVVIVGGGVHGLACAYYLGQRGLRDVAVLEQAHLGAGAGGFDHAVVGAGYRTPPGVALDAESVRIYRELPGTLGHDVRLSRRGHLAFAHTDTAVAELRARADLDQLSGAESRLIGPDEIRRLVPALDRSGRARHPVRAALYHPRGGLVSRAAVVRGYARGADRAGVEIHPHTGVTGIDVAGGRVTGVRTTRGDIATGTVLNAAGGACSTVARMAGVRLPVTTHPRQGLVTEPLGPFLDAVVVSADLGVSVSQADRGECAVAGEVEPYPSYSHRSTLPFLEAAAHGVLDLFPGLADARVLRQWAGICDVTPDGAPIVGGVPEVAGFYLDVGWGTRGVATGPAAGRGMADLIATGRIPELLAPFAITRFRDGALLGETAAASR